MTDTTEVKREVINTQNPYETILDVYLRKFNFPDQVPVDLTLHDGDFRGVMVSKDAAVDLQTFVMLLRHQHDPDVRYLVIHFNSEKLATVPFIAPVILSDDPESGEKFIFDALYTVSQHSDVEAQMKHPAVQTFFMLCLHFDDAAEEVTLTNFGKALSRILTTALSLPKPTQGEAIH